MYLSIARPSIVIIWGVIASILCLFSLAHAVYGMIGMIGAIVGIAWASITGMLVWIPTGYIDTSGSIVQ